MTSGAQLDASRKRGWAGSHVLPPPSRLYCSTKSLGNPIDVPGLLGSERGKTRMRLIVAGVPSRIAAHSPHAKCSPWDWLLHTVPPSPSTMRAAGHVGKADDTGAAGALRLGHQASGGGALIRLPKSSALGDTVLHAPPLPVTQAVAPLPAVQSLSTVYVPFGAGPLCSHQSGPWTSDTRYICVDAEYCKARQ